MTKIIEKSRLRGSVDPSTSFSDSVAKICRSTTLSPLAGVSTTKLKFQFVKTTLKRPNKPVTLKCISRHVAQPAVSLWSKQIKIIKSSLGCLIGSYGEKLGVIFLISFHNENRIRRAGFDQFFCILWICELVNKQIDISPWDVIFEHTSMDSAIKSPLIICFAPVGSCGTTRMTLCSARLNGLNFSKT